MKNLKYVWLSIIAIAFFAIACSNDSESATQNFDPDILTPEAFDKEAQLEYIFDVGVLSQIDSLKKGANNFKVLVEAYESSPNEENFEALKISWKEMTLIWKPLEVITIGDFALTSKVSAIHFWPINVEELEVNIENYSEDSFELGGTARGLGSIEYILFSMDYQTFIEDEHTENLIAYLGVLIDDLIISIDSYNNEWIDYESEFKTSLESSVIGTQNRLLNKIVFVFFDIIADKIQGPVNSNNEDSDILSSEAPYSELSLEIIKTQIDFVSKLFSGSLNNQEVPVDIYDQLISVDREDLVESLQEQFEKVNLTFSLVDNSLEDLVKDESLVLNQIEEEITGLHILISNDVFSALSIVTTVGDNDGD